ncbi:MAG: YjbQ family protein [Dehalococcoidia bacterium]|nr:YjbQ family protein [Dehalococcoidia bacterium]
MIERIRINTRSRVECHELTREVREKVKASGTTNGLCYLFVPHTTAAVTLNEHADPSVMKDISRQLGKLVPEHNDYSHAEGNADAHIKASLMGSSAVVFIEGGELVLGTWQGVFFCEFDGPRSRTVILKIAGDSA